MVNTPVLILDLCGGTGAWSKPYRSAGHNVINVTLPDFDVTRWHDYPELTTRTARGDVWGVFAAPPCTMFSPAQSIWWDRNNRYPTYSP